jgi:hypothetical protein
MDPSSQVMQILNYQSGSAAQLPAGLNITSIASYWTAPATDLFSIAWGTDDVLSSGEQDLKTNLGPGAIPQSNLISVQNPFNASFATSASGLLICGIDNVLHVLPCVGDNAQTFSAVESATTATVPVTIPSQVQISPSLVTLGSGGTAAFTATPAQGTVWSILEGGAGGQIDFYGNYTAPANQSGGNESFHIVAMNGVNPSQFGEATVTVLSSTTPTNSEGVWIVNGNGAVSELGGDGSSLGAYAGPFGNAAVAIDAEGDVWTVGSGSTTLEETNQLGVVIATSSSGIGGLNSPHSIAIDGNGQVWVTNASGSVSLFSNAGAPLSPSTGFTDRSLSSPSGVVIDLAGTVWIANAGNNSVTRLLGGAAPVAPITTAAANNTTGSKP